MIDKCLMLIVLATVLYALYGYYDLAQARKCIQVTPPDGWSVICGFEKEEL